MNPLEAHPPLALDEVLATVVDGGTKGMPEHEVALGDVPARRMSLADLSFPVMSLRSSALEHNVALTADYCRGPVCRWLLTARRRCPRNCGIGSCVPAPGDSPQPRRSRLR